MAFRLLAALAVAAAVLLAVALATPAPKEKPREPLYYATKAGAKWVYGYGNGGGLVTTVTEVETTGGAKVVTVDEVGKDGAVSREAT